MVVAINVDKETEMEEPQYSFRDFVKENGTPSGETNYDSIISESGGKKTQSAERMQVIESGMNSLRKKVMPGGEPPLGQLTINEVLALQHMGINPLFNVKVAKTKKNQSSKEMARRKSRREMKRKSVKANRKRK